MTTPGRRGAVGGVAVLLLLVALAALLAQPRLALAPPVAVPRLVDRVSLVAKLIGSNWADPPGIAIPNDRFMGVSGADLGAPAYYGGRWYFALGDTAYLAPVPWRSANFLVAYAHPNPRLGVPLQLDGYLNPRPAGALGMAPYRAMAPDPGPIIPSALFTVTWQGHSGLFAQYMAGGDFGGHDHWSAYSGIARYDDAARIFRPYKPTTYLWRRTDRHATDANRLQYSFGSCSFWADEASGYLYMVGSPTNRFGGVKLARLPLAAFLDPAAGQPWQYYLGGPESWAAARDEATVDARAPWLIPPRDPAFSLDKNYTTARYPPGADQCAYLTIAEFSVIYHPALRRYLLLTASSACRPNVLLLYSAPAMWGPWTAQPEVVTMPPTVSDPTWDYYAPYTAPELLQGGGRAMYFLASTYRHYGVYLYRAEMRVGPDR